MWIVVACKSSEYINQFEKKIKSIDLFWLIGFVSLHLHVKFCRRVNKNKLKVLNVRWTHWYTFVCCENPIIFVTLYKYTSVLNLHFDDCPFILLHFFLAFASSSFVWNKYFIEKIKVFFLHFCWIWIYFEYRQHDRYE